MRRLILVTLGLTLVATRPLSAGTFDRASIAPEVGVDALTRSVARENVGRDLFANPYSTVTIENVDIYNVFPYVEARTFQIVADPAWNRLVFGERGKSVKAFTGTGAAMGSLKEPRGMAVDESNRIYVADAGNNRILVLQASTEFDDITLTPLYEIRGLSRPFGVAFSDGGTPFTPADDRLYVADTGKNRIVAFALEGNRARQTAVLGELGSGPGRFAGPLAITVGRSAGANTRDVYVADAHTCRLIHLRDEQGSLQWVSDTHHDASVMTSLTTDHWGNLYAAAPNQGSVRKFNAALEPVAELRSDVSRPKNFHVPFVTVRDHRVGSVERKGRANGVSVDQWTDASGVRLWNLGVEVNNLAVASGDAPTAQFMLTDQANLTLEVTEASTGRSLVRRPAGSLGAGSHSIALTEDDLRNAGSGDLILSLSAASGYADGNSAVASAHFQGNGTSAGLPSQPVLLGNTPNPVMPSTRISFVLPSANARVSLKVMDASGRMVRTFENRFTAGLNQVLWDGTNDRGVNVPAGVYFYRLDVDRQDFTRKMIVVR